MKYFFLILLSIHFSCYNNHDPFKVWFIQIKEESNVFTAPRDLMLKRIRTSNKIKIFNDIKLIPSKCDSECIKCDNNRCSKCKKGYFLFESSCYQSCPNDKYADNYSFTCKNKISSPNYLKAYTTSRCFNSCGREFNECRYSI